MFSQPQIIIVIASFLIYYILFLLKSAIIIYDNNIVYSSRFSKFFGLLFVYMVFGAAFFAFVLDSVLSGNRAWFAWIIVAFLVIVPYIAAFVYAVSPESGEKVTDLIAYITMMPFISMM